MSTWAWELMMSSTSAQPSSQGLRGGERTSSGVPSLALPIARLVEHVSICSQFRNRRRSSPCARDMHRVAKFSHRCPRPVPQLR